MTNRVSNNAYQNKHIYLRGDQGGSIICKVVVNIKF